MKMKQIAILLLALFLTEAKAQTIVNGGIYANTTWTLSNSPYLMTGNIVVFPGVVLTIEPGVEVRVKENGFSGSQFYFESRGTVNMVGQPGALITFRADSAINTVGAWSGFYIKNSQGGAINYNYVSISNANTAFNYDGAVPGYIELHQCEFYYNGYAINVGLQLKADSCKFKGNYTAVAGWSLFEFNHCEFDSNNAALPIYATQLDIDSCTFTNNYVAITLNSSVFNSLNVSQTVFSNNSTAFYGANNGVIENCQFFSNIDAIVGANTVLITDCVFENNQTGLQTSFGTTVENCEINFNQVGVALSQIAFSQTAPVIQNNRICFNSNYNIDNQTDLNLFIPTNCFCETDSAIVESKILDGYDDITKGLISYAIFDTTCTNILKIVNKSPSVTAVAEIENSNISLFPNPATNEINFNNQNKFTRMDFMNLTGQVQLETILVPGSNTISLNQLNQGIYLARLSGNGVETKIVRITKL